MGDNRARRLLRTVKRAAYLAAVAPAVGRLPAALSYRMACWRGDWLFRCQAGKRDRDWPATCGWCSATSSARQRRSR